MKFRVGVKEVWEQGYHVEAESPEEALEIVAAGGGELIEGDFEYSRSLDSDGWSVEEAKEQE
jgi:hypothetical protein